MNSHTNAYDRVHYPGGAHGHTHPDRLAALGILYGMDPPAVEHCRVLEIGCSHGGNLIPMALGLPDSEFVGIDLAATPIETAKAGIIRVGARNIRLQQMDLMDIEPNLGEFDYIIAHGLYSWVPPQVQDKLLAICSRNLSANGVAFVSYNANPGGHVRRLLREMMLFHTRRMEDSEEQAREGTNFLRLVLEAMDAKAPFRMVFQEELERMSKRSQNAVYHDELSPNFLPVHFADFMERAAQQGLQFLSEAELSCMMEIASNPQLLAPLKQLADGDLIAYQQYLDFVRFRCFRQTLLCHGDIQLSRDRVADRLSRLFVASPLMQSAEHPDGTSEFFDSRGPGTIKTNNAALIACLRKLERIWPRAEPFDRLFGMARDQVPEAAQPGMAEDLPQAVLTLAAMTLVDLRTYQLPLAEGVSERPTASLLARLEAQAGPLVTTLLHAHVKLEDDLGRQFLQLLDGTRDRSALADAIAADHPEASCDERLEQIGRKLMEIYRMGLLIS
jgi:SAM-dependent methyltransferase